MYDQNNTREPIIISPDQYKRSKNTSFSTTSTNGTVAVLK